MKIKTSELTGAALDWAVAKCNGYSGESWQWVDEYTNLEGPRYSTDWAQGGPIIDEHEISVLSPYADHPEKMTGWLSYSSQRKRLDNRQGPNVGHGPTPLVSAMRCFVTSKQGNEVEVPDGLTPTDGKTTLNPNAVWPFRRGGA